MHVRYPVSWTQPLNLIYSIYDVYVFRGVWFTWSACAFVVSIFRYILSNLQPFDHWICWNNHNVISLYWSTMFQAHFCVCFDWSKTLVLNANSIFMSKFSILIAKKGEHTGKTPSTQSNQIFLGLFFVLFSFLCEYRILMRIIFLFHFNCFLPISSEVIVLPGIFQELFLIGWWNIWIECLT